jgi:integrase
MNENRKYLLLPSIPRQVISLDGQRVDTSQVRWQIRASIDGGNIFVLNWRLVDEMTVDGISVYSPRSRQLMRLYVADRLQRRKPSTVFVYFSSFIKFGRWLQQQEAWSAEVCRPNGFEWSRYSESLARAFHTWGVQNTASNGDFFRHLRIFYRWGVARRYPDFSLSLMRILGDIKAKMHPFGHHVRFRHPTSGPFSAAEKQMIVQAVRQELGQSKDRVLVMLLLELGFRPKAAVRLWNSDLICITTKQNIYYQLTVPRLKQRHAQRETRRRPISQRLGQLLTKLQVGESNDHLLWWLGDKAPETQLRQGVARWVRAAGLVSPRTGKRLKCNPRRFRYTLATHMAEEGASKLHIAALLDHSDLNYVDVYTATTAAIAKQVAEATDAAMQPLVRRFLGHIGDKPGDGEAIAIIPAATPHVPMPVLNVGAIGSCGRNVGQHGLCQLFPPLSCYRCPSFAAWRNGPHQGLHDSLKKYLSHASEQMDERIRMQLDETVAAAKELLTQLDEGGA